MNIEEAIDIIDKELHKKWDKKVEKKDGMTYIHLGDEEPLNEFDKASQRCLVEVQSLNREIERLNNDIKVLLKENENKEKVIKAQDNIINELEKESYLGMLENQNNNDYSKGLYTAYKYINDKIKELKGSDKSE